MFKTTVLFSLIAWGLLTAPLAYAGKVELTTYYPSPMGEYSTLNASKSFIPPKMDTGARDAITTTSNPPLAQGMVIFNTTADRLEVYSSMGWVSAGGGSGEVYAAADNSSQSFLSTNQQWWPVGATHDVTGMNKTIDLDAGNYLIEFSAANASIVSTDNGNVVITRWLSYPKVDILMGSPTAGYASVCSETITLDNLGQFPLTLRCQTNITTAGSYTVKVVADFQANSYCNANLNFSGSKVLTITETK